MPCITGGHSHSFPWRLYLRHCTTLMLMNEIGPTRFPAISHHGDSGWQSSDQDEITCNGSSHTTISHVSELLLALSMQRKSPIYGSLSACLFGRSLERFERQVPRNHEDHHCHVEWQIFWLPRWSGKSQIMLKKTSNWHENQRLEKHLQRHSDKQIHVFCSFEESSSDSLLECESARRPS